MPTLNPDLAYKLPAKRHAAAVLSSPLPNNWLEQLVEYTIDCLSPKPTYNFRKKMSDHIGSASTYQHKDLLIKNLKAIYPVMMDDQVSQDNKASIASKLVERAESCTPGFHNGVNSIVDGFIRPESLDDLLYRIRHDIISKTASAIDNDVHVNNRFYTIAQNNGYGVYPPNPDDGHRGVIEDLIISYKLKEAFARDFRMFSILNDLESQLRSELLYIGYPKSSEQGYEPDIMDKLLDFLTTLFKEAPVVVTQREALQLQQDYQQRTNHFMAAKRLEVRTIIPVLKLEQLNDLLIRNKFPESLKNKYLHGLSSTQIKELVTIQQEYLHFIHSDEMEILLANMNASTNDRISPFQLPNSPTLNLDWNRIIQTLWEEFFKKGYFTLTATEKSALDHLMNQNESFTTKDIEILSLTRPEVLILLRVPFFADNTRQVLLRWFINSAPIYIDESITSLLMPFFTGDKRRELVRWFLNSAPGFIDETIATLLIIQDLSKQDEALVPVIEEYKSKIDALYQSVTCYFFEKLTWNLSYKELVLPNFLSDDQLFIMKAITIKPWVLKLASPRLQEDKDFVLMAVNQSAVALKYISSRFKEDKEVVLSVVRKDGLALQYVSFPLNEDKDVVFAAVNQNSLALRHASSRFYSDKEIMLSAVNQDWRALIHVSDALKVDRDIVLAGVRKNAEMVHFLLRARQNSCLGFPTHLFFGDPLLRLKNDRAFMLELVSLNGLALQYASKRLRGDLEVVQAAIGQNEGAFQFASPQLQRVLSDRSPIQIWYHLP
jgi:hypothetical protein